MGKWYQNGKLRTGKLPDGYYHHYHGDDHPTLVDPEYRGFKIVLSHAKEAQRYGTACGFISDTMDGVRNPVDGKMYDSKSNYYRTVKDAGCEIVGNDAAYGKAKPKELSRAERMDDIKQAFETTT